jgi:hypothetical protein
MRKGIEIFIDGDVKQFLECWNLPPGIERIPCGDTLRFFLHDEATGHFARIKNVAAELGDAVELESSFFICDVTPTDCDDAELLFLTPISLDGIGLTASFADRADMLRQRELPLYTQVDMVGRLYINTGGGLHLFHEKLIEKLCQKNIADHLMFVPLKVEVASGKGAKGWYAAFCTHDLGTANTHERFIPEFSRANWHGEPFNTSLAFGDGDFLFVSQKVRQIFRQCSEEQVGTVEFEPIALV